MIICKKCGTANTAGDQFCGNCGAFLEWEGEVVAQDGSQQTPTGTTQAAPVPTPPIPDPSATAVMATPSPGPRVGTGPICSNCGLQNEAGLTFCRRCGAELGTAAISTQPVLPSPDDGSTGERRVPIVPILVGGFAVGVLLIALVLFVGGSGPSATASPTAPGIAIGSGSPPASPGGSSATPDPSEPAETAAPSSTASPEPSESAEPSGSAEPTIAPTEPPLPDLVAFSSNRVKSRFDLFLAGPDGKVLRQLTTEGTANNYPSWSHDRTKIAYASTWAGGAPSNAGKSQIWVVTQDGKTKVPLFAKPGEDTTPAWSPDDTQIAFVRMFHGFRQVFIVKVDPATGKAAGAAAKLTDDDSEQTRPSWSPDGTHIVFRSGRTAGADLVVVPVGGGDPESLTSSSDALDREPAWAPATGPSAIAFSSGSGTEFDIFVVAVNAEGSATGIPQQLTDTSGQERFPTWSPDGQSIIYWAGESGQEKLFIVKATGGAPKRFLQDTKGRSLDPGWN